MLRNFARPVNAVALSPEYKYDRAYLSGGLAGNLILTVGGRRGVSANANTNSAAAAAQGWLGSLGLGPNTGKDTILHSGEGTINTIKWSLSGKFIAWVNEKGIKIMRSNLKLGSEDLEYAWRRIAHIDRPDRAQWEEMAAVWKARVEWIDDKHLETDDDPPPRANGTQTSNTPKSAAAKSLEIAKNGRSGKRNQPEKLVVGWGDTVWVLQVKPEGVGTGRTVGEKAIGSASIVHQ
jgi:vacuolar protein sorting-associated protein 41